MKVLFVFFAFVLTLNASADIGPVNRSSNLSATGSIIEGSKEQWFVKVQNKSGGSIAAGAITVWDLTADDGVGVTTSTTAGSTPACIMVAACAANALCLCQWKGYMAAALFGNSGGNAVAGKPFFINESSAGYIQADASAAAADIPAGIFYDASSATGSIEVFINLR